MGFSTIAIHAGNEPDIATGAVSVPIYQTSTFAQESLGVNKGYEYARTKNPTRTALERNIAALEGAKHGFAFASGMAAIDTTLRLLKSGDHVILGDNTYGGTFRLFDRILSNYGIEFDLVNTSDAANLEPAFKPNTKMVFVETPTNPVMTVTDLAAVSNIAHAHGAKVVCDNTFLSPYFQRPIELGVDIVRVAHQQRLGGHRRLGGAVLGRFVVRQQNVLQPQQKLGLDVAPGRGLAHQVPPLHDVADQVAARRHFGAKRRRRQLAQFANIVQ